MWTILCFHGQFETHQPGNLASEYGKNGTPNAQLVVHEGSIIRYLGNEIIFLECSARDFNADQRIILPAYSFQNRDDIVALSAFEREEFHSVVAKLLYMSSAWPDLATGMPILTRRVLAPDRNDQRKLDLAIRYLNGTRVMCLILWRCGRNLLTHHMLCTTTVAATLG